MLDQETKKKIDSARDILVGKIPEHWKATRLKYGIEFIESGKRDLVEHSDILSIGGEHIGTDYRLNLKNLKYVSEDFYNKNKKGRIQKGDILIVKDGATIGKTAYIDFQLKQKMLLNEHVYRVVAHEYIYYFILSSFFQSKIWSENNSSAQEGLNLSTIKNISILKPLSEEQKAIANFLDKETSRIDSLIQKKEKQIELLKEKRSALITQAVTKGLNPNVKMKDSGIEWLGKIPEHWEIKRLKFLLSEPLKYGANESAEYDEPSWPRYVRITDINENNLLRDETFKSIPEEIASSYLLEDRDMLFARSGTVGKTFLYQKSWGRVAFAGYLIRARFDREKNLPKFTYYFSKSRIYEEWIKSNLIQATIQNVSAEKYSNLFIPLPQIDEQKIIVNFLDKETSCIDSLIEKVKKSIELLKEYRSALVTSAVTGKIDVRESQKEITNVVQLQKSRKEATPLFKKTVLGAEIVAQLKDDPHFGRTKFMKTLYLCSAHLQIPLKGTYKRSAAGPLDNSIYKMEGIMKKNKWFEVIQKGSMYKYKALENSGGYKAYFDKYWGDYKEKLNQLLGFAKKFTTEQSEIVDTIYAVWNDFLIEGKAPSDNEIVNEVKNNWHKSKKRFSAEKLKKAIQWMKEQNLIPQGYGQKTKK